MEHSARCDIKAINLYLGLSTHLMAEPAPKVLLLFSFIRPLLIYPYILPTIIRESLSRAYLDMYPKNTRIAIITSYHQSLGQTNP